ncbi:uncharacterized protein LOC105194722 [Solenopsis invicta]|uniref:uncharacterized protein LOC105194722 n=1 Tax=Solenopsis invicta TaxID=13686 RepID=UPI00193D5CD0|nr:uncharacterized protein LOC105194722 [Solenopsis invicta]
MDSRDLRYFRHFMISKIIHLEIAIRDIKKSVKQISEKLSLDLFDKKEKENINTLKDFPLKEQHELDILERKLQNDTSFRDEMIKQLTHIRSDLMRSTSVRIMKLILSNELAVKYSWFGAKKKQSFSSLNLCKVVITVLRKTHPDASDDQISAPIKIWLAHAKERLDRQRQHDNANNAEEDTE